ncbi:hypothetical protein F5Y13DRAFT_187010 [Hypoxylon sp. FL1857]|nr:hypothetical protein F5Y13DRAFT_187010 [Hypoxylon sp. FL1857]
MESRMVLLQEKKTKMINSTMNADDAATDPTIHSSSSEAPNCPRFLTNFCLSIIYILRITAAKQNAGALEARVQLMAHIMDMGLSDSGIAANAQFMTNTATKINTFFQACSVVGERGGRGRTATEQQAFPARPPVKNPADDSRTGSKRRSGRPPKRNNFGPQPKKATKVRGKKIFRKFSSSEIADEAGEDDSDAEFFNSPSSGTHALNIKAWHIQYQRNLRIGHFGWGMSIAAFGISSKTSAKMLQNRTRKPWRTDEHG